MAVYGVLPVGVGTGWDWLELAPEQETGGEEGRIRAGLDSGEKYGVQYTIPLFDKIKTVR